MLTAEHREPSVFERREHFIGGNWHAASGGGPFGGRKQSGLGSERAVEGLESFLELKSVALPAGYELRGE
jgi:hypothetical protein